MNELPAHRVWQAVSCCVSDVKFSIDTEEYRLI